MPEANRKGIASHITALKSAVPEPANGQPVERISRKELEPTKSQKISISQQQQAAKKVSDCITYTTLLYQKDLSGIRTKLVRRQIIYDTNVAYVVDALVHLGFDYAACF